MHEARTSLGMVGTLLVAGCGGGGLPSQAIMLTPTVGTTSVMECLDQEAQKLGYRIIRIDRQDGVMVAERRDKNPDISRPREYAGGDMITVNRMKKEENGVRPLAIVPSSYIMEWLANGSNQKTVKSRESVLGDAKALSERCRL
jgi:hypothetical protein